MSVLSYLARRCHFISSHDPSLIIRDVTYISGSEAHVNHKLDIFIPSTSNNLLSPSSNEHESQTKLPIIVHIHGGGWVRGSRKNEWRGGPTIGRACSKQGFIGVIASYRLARTSLLSFATWSLIFGLIIIIISFVLLSWQLILGYLIFMTIIYSYNFLYKTRIPVNLDHVSFKIEFYWVGQKNGGLYIS